METGGPKITPMGEEERLSEQNIKAAVISYRNLRLQWGSQGQLANREKLPNQRSTRNLIRVLRSITFERLFVKERRGVLQKNTTGDKNTKT